MNVTRAAFVRARGWRCRRVCQPPVRCELPVPSGLGSRGCSRSREASLSSSSGAQLVRSLDHRLVCGSSSQLLPRRGASMGSGVGGALRLT